MKSKTTLFCILFVFFICLKTRACKDIYTLSVKKDTKKEIQFLLKTNQLIYISIIDTNNNIIISEQAKLQKGIIKTFNLEGFTEGNYYLIITSDERSDKYKICINKYNADLSKNTLLEVYQKKSSTKRLIKTK